MRPSHFTARAPSRARPFGRGQQRILRGARSGFTLAEVMIVMILILVATGMLASTVTSVARQKNINRENAIVSDAASSTLERMRAMPLEEVFALFNADLSDDPGGPGTGFGPHFDATPLQADPADPDGRAGLIEFPAINVAAPGDPVDLVLRENLVDDAFGMPRDLNGDSIINGDDRTSDYFILPVRLTVRWSGKNGVREYSLFTTLTEFNWQ